VFEIGNTLREARVRRSLTLQQVEEDTKIRVKYVQAMENEDFDVMPGATYVKGFLRTYSTYLGVDPDVVVDEYRSRSSGVRVAEHHEPFGGSSTLGSPRSHRGRNTIVFVAVICLLLLTVIIVLGLNPGGDKGQPSTKPGALGIGSPSPKPSQTPTPAASASIKPGLENVLRIVGENGDCWVQVRRDDAAGTVLFSGTITQGKGRSFKGKVLWVRMGIPANVKVIIQGHTAKPIDSVAPLDFVVHDGKMTRQG
jgi:cytoskeleton protein RodZ